MLFSNLILLFTILPFLNGSLLFQTLLNLLNLDFDKSCASRDNIRFKSLLFQKTVDSCGHSVSKTCKITWRLCLLLILVICVEIERKITVAVLHICRRLLSPGVGLEEFVATCRFVKFNRA